MRRKKPKNGNRLANTHEKAWQGWLKQRPCCVSGRFGVDVHHMYGSSAKHEKQLIGHIACIPLHPDYHRGIDGIHTLGKRLWESTFAPQKQYFESEYKAYLADGGEPFSEAEIQAVIGYTI